MASEGQRGRGRPVGSGTIKAPTLVSFQLPEEEKLLLMHYARVKGMTLSELLRQMCKVETIRVKHGLYKFDETDVPDLELRDAEQGE